MKSKLFWVLSTAAFISLSLSELQAAYTLKDGWLVNANEMATMSAQEHFECGSKALEECDWREAFKQFNIVTCNFPGSAYCQEAFFYVGVAHFYLKEYDLANDSFSEYLNCQNNPRLFQEAVEYKFNIAECFKNGAKRRFFGTKKLPKWASGGSLALTIYDEVIAAVPCHEIAAKALVSKGYLLWSYKQYRQAVESFQMVIRRFPKHELAPECYLTISQVYLDQSFFEFQNSDILAFAEINLKKFNLDFPREERLCEAEQNFREIKEIYARGLYETGRFYERTCKRRAALIYYHNAIHQFPDTQIAECCQERIECLDPGSSVPYNYPIDEDNADGVDIDVSLKPFQDDDTDD